MPAAEHETASQSRTAAAKSSTQGGTAASRHDLPGHRRGNSSSDIRISAQEDQFIAAGLERASPMLKALWIRSRWHPAYGTLSAPLSQSGAMIAQLGLGTLERKINERLQSELTEDEEDTLINDLHSIQLTRERMAIATNDPVRKFIEDRPYTAVAIALGLGWLLGKVNRPL
jgi:ElaB/YqjD/DUF883 family membrane-anchored ribosome-binding protein